LWRKTDINGPEGLESKKSKNRRRRCDMKKLFLVVVVVGIFIFQGGCEGLIVEQAGIQRAQTPYKIEKAKPSEVKEEFVPEKTEIISEIPDGTYPMLKLGNRPVSPVSKNTVAKLQDEARQTGQIIVTNKEKMVIETQGGDGIWYRGWVEPGIIFLAELKQQNPETEAKEYKLVRIGLCRNPVRGVEIRVFPAKTTITTAVTERYQDVKTKIDYTPALWTGLAGLLIGGIIVGLIRPRKKRIHSV